MKIQITEMPGSKIQAVKALRWIVPGTGLKEAADAYDAVQRGETFELAVTEADAIKLRREGFGFQEVAPAQSVKSIVITYSGATIPVYETVGEISNLISQAKHDEGMAGWVALEPNVLIRWDRIEAVGENQD